MREEKGRPLWLGADSTHLGIYREEVNVYFTALRRKEASLGDP